MWISGYLCSRDVGGFGGDFPAGPYGMGGGGQWGGPEMGGMGPDRRGLVCHSVPCSTQLIVFCFQMCLSISVFCCACDSSGFDFIQCRKESNVLCARNIHHTAKLVAIFHNMLLRARCTVSFLRCDERREKVFVISRKESSSASQ